MGFDTRWDEVLLSTPEVPSDSVLERLYKMRIRESDQPKTVLALCEQDNEHMLQCEDDKYFLDSS